MNEAPKIDIIEPIMMTLPPPAYIMAEVEVTDLATYATYRAQTPGVVERYGGRFIVRGALTLEGDGPPGRLVVLGFPDLAAARRFYELPEYQAILGLRQRAASSRLVLVEGHAPAG